MERAHIPRVAAAKRAHAYRATMAIFRASFMEHTPCNTAASVRPACNCPRCRSARGSRSAPQSVAARRASCWLARTTTASISSTTPRRIPAARPSTSWATRWPTCAFRAMRGACPARSISVPRRIRKPTQRGLSRKHVIEACHQALQRLRVDYLDLYFCHRPDPDTPIEETVRAMDDLIRQGKVLYWGTSEWPAETIREAHEIARANICRRRRWSSRNTTCCTANAWKWNTRRCTANSAWAPRSGRRWLPAC